MTTRTIHDTQRERGLISVEAALLLPIFMFLLLACIDFSRLLWTQSVVSNAAAEGARLAVLEGPTSADVAACVSQRLLAGGVTAAPAVSVGARTPDQPVAVNVGVSFEFLALPAIVFEIAGMRTVSATSVMIHER